ncbi:MAG: hypothetical protein ACFE8N_13005 [Promethearchaeota archaeon]
MGLPIASAAVHSFSTALDFNAFGEQNKSTTSQKFSRENFFIIFINAFKEKKLDKKVKY